MDLSRYEQTKFALADLLRTLPWTSQRAEQLRALFGRLAEDRFNLVVVGRFSRGKSSLMNAILGADWLPTGIVPLTSVVTAVAHGEAESVILHHEHTSLVTDIALAELSAHITERGNPGNRQRISVAEVRLPAEILRRGFHFVDTPGLGSSIAENTRTTEAFLPEADALLLVTSFDSPLSGEERRVLEDAHRSGRRVFVAVNKQDAATPDERREVLEHLEDQLAQVFGAGALPVFPVSARSALAARQAGDEPGLEASGLPRLEDALVVFLVNGKRQNFLRLMCDRVAALLAEEPAAGPALDRLGLLRASFDDDTGLTVASPAAAGGTTVAAGCGICAHIERTVFDCLADMQGRLRRETAVRQDLARRGGLCGPHAWQLAGLAAPREVCTGLASVLDARADMLLRLAARLPSAIQASVDLGRLLEDRDCPACEAAGQGERDAIAAIRDGFVGGAAVAFPCMPHFAMLLEELPQESVSPALEQQAARLARLSEDARRFALRQDASRTDLGGRDDRDIGTRTVRALVGHPDALAGHGTHGSTGRAAARLDAGHGPERPA